MDEEDAQKVVIEVTRIELKRTYGESTVRGEDRQGNVHVFHFLPKTKVRRLIPTDSTRTMAEIMSGEGAPLLQGANQSRFPLLVEQNVLVAWKRYPTDERKVAVKFTVFGAKN